MNKALFFGQWEGTQGIDLTLTILRGIQGCAVHFLLQIRKRAFPGSRCGLCWLLPWENGVCLNWRDWILERLQCYTCVPGFCHASLVSSSLSFHLACEMQATANLLTVAMWARSWDFKLANSPEGWALEQNSESHSRLWHSEMYLSPPLLPARSQQSQRAITWH